MTPSDCREGSYVKTLENAALTRQLLEWLLREPRTYEDVMSAWRTSCPRLPIWEDAVDHGFVRVVRGPVGAGLRVTVTDAGRAFLETLDPA